MTVLNIENSPRRILEVGADGSLLWEIQLRSTSMRNSYLSYTTTTVNG